MASPPPSKRAKLVDESTVESLINDVEQLQAELEQVHILYACLKHLL